MKPILFLILLFCFGTISNVMAQSELGEKPLIGYRVRPTFFLGITGGLLSSKQTGGGITQDTRYIRTVAEGQLGFSIGLVAEQSLKQWFRLSGRLEYRSMPGVVYQAPPGVEVLLPTGAITIDTVTTTVVEYQDLSLGIHGLAYPLQLLKGVKLLCGVGTSISVALSGTRTHYRGEISYPSSKPLGEAAGSFKEDEKQVKLSSDERILDLQQFRVGAVGTLGIELQLGGTYLIPNISYDHSLTNVTSRPEDDGWKVHSLAFRLDIRKEL